MAYLWGYIAALIAFLALDAVWLKLVMRPIFERHIGEYLRETPMLAAAAAFYALYIGGVIYFAATPAVREQNWWIAVAHGALLGFLAYGTYEATNFATIKGWHLQMVITDVAWGTILTAISALTGYAVLRSASG